MENKGLLAAYNTLNMIEDWRTRADVWLNSTIHERDNLSDPETDKPMPLDRMIRGGWQSVMHGSAATAEHYQMLMGCGGPAIRIIGTLNKEGEAITVELQFKYGTFEKCWRKVDLAEDTTETLLAYANSFYWA